MKRLFIEHFSEIMTGFGAIASALGAWIAWLQYRKAKASAANAKSSELKVFSIINKTNMSRDTQKIKGLVERLSEYVRRGQNIRKAGLSLSADIDRVIAFRNDFASNSRYAKEHMKELSEINKIATSVDFKDVGEDKRISLVNSLIEELNNIAVSIDEKVVANE